MVAGTIAGLAFAGWAPGQIKRFHVNRQNRLIERCRAHYVFALEVFGIGNEEGALELLRRIRRIESRWRFGNSFAYRIALAAYAVWIGYLGNVLLRWCMVFGMEAAGAIERDWSAQRYAQD